MKKIIISLSLAVTLLTTLALPIQASTEVNENLSSSIVSTDSSIIYPMFWATYTKSVTKVYPSDTIAPSYIYCEEVVNGDIYRGTLDLVCVNTVGLSRYAMYSGLMAANI